MPTQDNTVKNTFNDGATVETREPSGTVSFTVNGALHRTDGPAVIYADGGKEWWQKGELHRTDGPATEYPDGEQAWYQNGKLHRDDGGPALIIPGIRQEWRKDGQLHREDGPAIIQVDGSKFWFQEGKLHREDGPAVETSVGEREWWVHGVKRERKISPVEQALIDARRSELRAYFADKAEKEKILPPANESAATSLPPKTPVRQTKYGAAGPA